MEAETDVSAPPAENETISDDVEVSEAATDEIETEPVSTKSDEPEAVDDAEIVKIEPTYSLEDMDELRKWWEIPCVAHFCSLFRAAFDLPDFDIEELEEALLDSGTPDGSFLMCDLLSQLLNGCYARTDIKSYNFEIYMKDIYKKQAAADEGFTNPLEDTSFQMLPVRTKLELLQGLCDYRLDSEDVQDLLKGLDGDNLRVEPMGRDQHGATYWYFYGVRLYKEDPEFKPEEKKKDKKKSKSKPPPKEEKKKEVKKKGKKKKGKASRKKSKKPKPNTRARHGRNTRRNSVQDEPTPAEEKEEDEIKEEVGEMPEEVTPVDETAAQTAAQTAADKPDEEDTQDKEVEDMEQDPVAEGKEVGETGEENREEEHKEEEGKEEEKEEATEAETDDTPRRTRRLSRRAQEAAAAKLAAINVANMAKEESVDEDMTEDDNSETEEDEEPVENGEAKSDPEDDLPLSAALKLAPVSTNRWHLVCQDQEDWEALAESFKDSKVRCEKTLYRTITEDFLPEIPRIIEEKERDMKRRALENAPRRTSCRLEEKQKQREEEEKLLAIQMAAEERIRTEEEEARRRMLEIEKAEIQKRQREAREKQRERMREEREKAVEKRAKRAEVREEKARLLAERERLIAEGVELPPELQNLDAVTKDDDKQDGEHSESDELQDKMTKILYAIKTHEDSWPFWEPVKEEFAPDYFKVIETPMDLTTIEKKLDNKEYTNIQEFADDFTLLFDNCEKYNGENSDFTYMARALEKMLRFRVKKLLPKRVARYDVDEDYVVADDLNVAHGPGRPMRHTAVHAMKNINAVMKDDEDEGEGETGRGKSNYTIVYPALKSKGEDMRTAEGQARFLQALQAAKRKEAAEEFSRKGDKARRSLMCQTGAQSIPRPPLKTNIEDPVKGIIIQNNKNKVQLLAKTVSVTSRYNGQKEKDEVKLEKDDPELAKLPMHQRIKAREAQKAMKLAGEPKPEQLNDYISVVRKADVSRLYSGLIQKSASPLAKKNIIEKGLATPDISPKVVHISRDDFIRLQSEKAKVIVVPSKDKEDSAGTVIHLSTGGIRTPGIKKDPLTSFIEETQIATPAQGVVPSKDVKVLEHSDDKVTVLKTTPSTSDTKDGPTEGEEVPHPQEQMESETAMDTSEAPDIEPEKATEPQPEQASPAQVDKTAESLKTAKIDAIIQAMKRKLSPLKHPVEVFGETPKIAKQLVENFSKKAGLKKRLPLLPPGTKFSAKDLIEKSTTSKRKGKKQSAAVSQETPAGTKKEKVVKKNQPTKKQLKAAKVASQASAKETSQSTPEEEASQSTSTMETSQSAPAEEASQSTPAEESSQSEPIQGNTEEDSEPPVLTREDTEVAVKKTAHKAKTYGRGPKTSATTTQTPTESPKTPKTIMKVKKAQPKQVGGAQTSEDGSPVPKKRLRKSVSWSKNLTEVTSFTTSSKETEIQSQNQPKTRSSPRASAALYKDGIHSRLPRMHKAPIKPIITNEPEVGLEKTIVNGMIVSKSPVQVKTVKTYSKKEPERKRSYESDFFLDEDDDDTTPREPSPPKLTRISQQVEEDVDHSEDAPPDIVSDSDSPTKTSKFHLSNEMLYKESTNLHASLIGYSGGRKRKGKDSNSSAAESNDEDSTCAKVIRRTKRSPGKSKLPRLTPVTTPSYDDLQLKDPDEPRKPGRPAGMITLDPASVQRIQKGAKRENRRGRKKRTEEEEEEEELLAQQEPVLDTVSEDVDESIIQEQTSEENVEDTTEKSAIDHNQDKSEIGEETLESKVDEDAAPGNPEEKEAAEAVPETDKQHEEEAVEKEATDETCPPNITEDAEAMETEQESEAATEQEKHMEENVEQDEQEGETQMEKETEEQNAIEETVEGNEGQGEIEETVEANEEQGEIEETVEGNEGQGEIEETVEANEEQGEIEETVEGDEEPKEIEETVEETEQNEVEETIDEVEDDEVTEEQEDAQEESEVVETEVVEDLGNENAEEEKENLNKVNNEQDRVEDVNETENDFDQQMEETEAASGETEEVAKDETVTEEDVDEVEEEQQSDDVEWTQVYETADVTEDSEQVDETLEDGGEGSLETAEENKVKGGETENVEETLEEEAEEEIIPEEEELADAEMEDNQVVAGTSEETENVEEVEETEAPEVDYDDISEEDETSVRQAAQEMSQTVGMTGNFIGEMISHVKEIKTQKEEAEKLAEECPEETGVIQETEDTDVMEPEGEATETAIVETEVEDTGEAAEETPPTDIVQESEVLEQDNTEDEVVEEKTVGDLEEANDNEGETEDLATKQVEEAELETTEEADMMAANNQTVEGTATEDVPSEVQEEEAGVNSDWEIISEDEVRKVQESGTAAEDSIQGETSESLPQETDQVTEVPKLVSATYEEISDEELENEADDNKVESVKEQAPQEISELITYNPELDVNVGTPLQDERVIELDSEEPETLGHQEKMETEQVVTDIENVGDEVHAEQFVNQAEVGAQPQTVVEPLDNVDSRGSAGKSGLDQVEAVGDIEQAMEVGDVEMEDVEQGMDSQVEPADVCESGVSDEVVQRTENVVSGEVIPMETDCSDEAEKCEEISVQVIDYDESAKYQSTVVCDSVNVAPPSCPVLDVSAEKVRECEQVSEEPPTLAVEEGVDSKTDDVCEKDSSSSGTQQHHQSVNGTETSTSEQEGEQLKGSDFTSSSDVQNSTSVSCEQSDLPRSSDQSPPGNSSPSKGGCVDRNVFNEFTVSPESKTTSPNKSPSSSLNLPRGFAESLNKLKFKLPAKSQSNEDQPPEDGSS